MVAERPPGQPFQNYEQAAAIRYDRWYESEKGRAVAAAEELVLAELLKTLSPTATLLDVGCGTGQFSRWFSSLGLDVVGLDAAPGMLSVARGRGGGPRYLRGSALALPFPDRSVDVVSFVTSLEFVSNPALALTEAGRVARQGVLLGVLSSISPLGVWRRAQSAFRPTPYRGAHFYSPFELEQLARGSWGARVRAVRWRTGLWPDWLPGPLRRLPLGAFVGMAVRLDGNDFT